MSPQRDATHGKAQPWPTHTPLVYGDVLLSSSPKEKMFNEAAIVLN